MNYLHWHKQAGWENKLAENLPVALNTQAIRELFGKLSEDTLLVRQGLLRRAFR